MNKQEIRYIKRAMKLIDEDGFAVCHALTQMFYQTDLKNRFQTFYDIHMGNYKSVYGWYGYTSRKDNQNKRLTALALFMVAEKDVV